MEVMFENRYVMNKARFIEWLNHPIKINIIRFVLWIPLLIVTLYFTAVSVIDEDMVFSFFYMTMVMFCIYRCFFRNRVLLEKQFKQLAVIQEEWERVIQVADTIKVVDGNTTSEYQWTQIKELIINKNYMILTFGNGQGLRLLKEGFTLGTPDSFLDFISEEYKSIPISFRK